MADTSIGSVSFRNITIELFETDRPADAGGRGRFIAKIGLIAFRAQTEDAAIERAQDWIKQAEQQGS